MLDAKPVPKMTSPTQSLLAVNKFQLVVKKKKKDPCATAMLPFKPGCAEVKGNKHSFCRGELGEV